MFATPFIGPATALSNNFSRTFFEAGSDLDSEKIAIAHGVHAIARENLIRRARTKRQEKAQSETEAVSVSENRRKIFGNGDNSPTGNGEEDYYDAETRATANETLKI